jgi:hypothetical protein
VIIGKLIPAGTGLDYYQKLREEAIRLYEEEELAADGAGGLLPPDGDASALEESTLAEEEAPTPEPV